MVRAAASGLIDYTRADPKDINWKMRHRLMFAEMQRREELALLDVVHRHWLTYVLKQNLTPESAENVKTRASESLSLLQTVIFPWREGEKAATQKDTINDTQNMIERYKAWQATLKKKQQQ